MNRYEVFVKVVECGSFTRAADELGYTQSAVSQMVHTLEEELSAVLLRRGRRSPRTANSTCPISVRYAAPTANCV